MRADLLGVLREKAVALQIVLRLQGVEICVHGGFGIHDNRFSSWKSNDEIRAQALALVRGGGCLEGEIAMLLHAGELDHPAELHLPPLAAAGGLAQGFDECSRLPLQAELAFPQGPHLLLELRVGALAEFFNFTDA